MNNIEDTTPIEILASRVWGGTQWHHPHIEKMVAELRRLRAQNIDLSAKVAALEVANSVLNRQVYSQVQADLDNSATQAEGQQ